MIEEFDEILMKCGGHGKYQTRIAWGLAFPTSLIISIAINMKIFQALVPSTYWCQVPGRSNHQFSAEEWKNLTIPRTVDGNFEKCLHYEITQESPLLISNETISCSKWDHKISELEESLATSNGWLCDKEFYSTNLMSFNAIGNSVGTLLLPILADRITGRLRMFWFVNTLEIITSLSMMLTSSYKWILALFFLRGLSFQTSYQMILAIALELVPPESREFITFYSFVAWAGGMSITALVAWAIPHWVHLTLISYAIYALMYGYYWFLPESPRWLLANGRVEECVDILASVAKVNSAPIKREVIKQEVLNVPKTTSHSINVKEFMKYPHLVKNCSTVALQAFLVYIVYYCILLNVKILPDNYYLSYFILSICELPSNVTSLLGTKYLGRRGTLVLNAFVLVIMCCVGYFVNSNVPVLMAVTALMKIAVTNSLFTIYLMSSEISPTRIRTSIMGFVILCGMMGSIFSPQFLILPPNMYYGVLGGVCLAALVCALFIPETMELPLPQTYDEAERIGAGVPFFTWVNYWNWKKYAPVPLEER